MESSPYQPSLQESAPPKEVKYSVSSDERRLVALSKDERFLKVASLLERLASIFNGNPNELWGEDAERICLALFHEDFEYEPPIRSTGQKRLKLHREQLINVLRQFKHMGGIMEIQWIVEAPTSCESPYGQLTGACFISSARTPMSLKQTHASVVTLSADGRILRHNPKETQISNILALQADFLTLMDTC